MKQDELVSRIKTEIAIGTKNRERMVTFHAMVVCNARMLSNMDPVEFCRKVGVSDSYAIEFKKMLALAPRLSAHRVLP